MAFVIDLQKESFKFSVSHFTIFAENRAERMHGHNYYVRAQLTVEDFENDIGMAFDFNLVKPIIKKLCEELDEYVLIPKDSKYLKISESKSSIEVLFHKKRYVFPSDDVRLLPIQNVTTEELARLLGLRLTKSLPDNIGVISISLTVKETEGQGVTFTTEPRTRRRARG